MIANKRVLINGAGISGLTLAYWLRNHGFFPTVIEKRANLSDRGYMLDFYGSGFDVAEKMGIIEKLRAKSDQYPISRLMFVDGAGKAKATLDVDKFREVLKHRYFPLMRGDLEASIYDSVNQKVPIRFETSIHRIDVRSGSVGVEFSDGSHESFDLLVGAGGIHSSVRRMIWGDERQFSRYLGFYVACGVVDDIFGDGNTFLSHFEPNLQTAVYSIGENKLAIFFAFRSDKLTIHGRLNQKKFLAEKFGSLGWVIPELISRMQESDDFFFDAVAQIQVNNWHSDRIALVGDACQCLTLLAGQGASMGMAGAYLLAEELRNAEGDYTAAFPAYQARVKPEIDRRQKAARSLAGAFVPRNKFEIAAAHLMFNAAMLPGLNTLFARQIGVKSLIK